MNLSAKWKNKKEDQKAGLSFDWRFLVPCGWSLFYYSLPIALLGLAALAWIDVRSDTSLQQSGKRLGNIFYLKEEEHGGLNSFLSRNLPLASRGPVWADPASLGVDSDVFPTIQGGLNTGDLSLELLEPDKPRGELNHLSGSLVLLSSGYEGYQGEVAKGDIEVRPFVSRRDMGLSGFMDSGSYPEVEGRPDMGEADTVFWVVVDQWGIPGHVVITQKSGDRAVDAAAEFYVKTLRWEPSSKVRSGVLGVGWKEAGNSHES